MKKLTSLLKGLVLHLPLNQESYNPATKRFSDKTPYSNHGTSTNAASFSTDRMGNSNQVTTFNGSSDYVDCGNNESLDITDAITMSVWVKSNSDSIHQRIISKNNSCTIVRDGTTGAGNMQFYIWGVPLRSPAVSTPLNEWTHIVCVADDATGKLYIYKNGVNMGTPTGGFVSIPSSVSGLYVGGDVYFNGSIADVRIYNRALSASEIKLLYNSYNPRVII